MSREKELPTHVLQAFAVLSTIGGSDAVISIPSTHLSRSIDHQTRMETWYVQAIRKSTLMFNIVLGPPTAIFPDVLSSPPLHPQSGKQAILWPVETELSYVGYMQTLIPVETKMVRYQQECQAGSSPVLH